MTHDGLKEATAEMDKRETISARAIKAAPIAEKDRPLVEQFRIVAKQWVEADSASNLLEDTKSSVFSQRVLPLVEGGLAVNRAELIVRASPEWHEHLRVISDARRAANLLKVQMRWIEMCERAANSGAWAERTEHRMGRSAT